MPSRPPLPLPDPLPPPNNDRAFYMDYGDDIEKYEKTLEQLKQSLADRPLPQKLRESLKWQRDERLIAHIETRLALEKAKQRFGVGSPVIVLATARAESTESDWHKAEKELLEYDNRLLKSDYESLRETSKELAIRNTKLKKTCMPRDDEKAATTEAPLVADLTWLAGVRRAVCHTP